MDEEIKKELESIFADSKKRAEKAEKKRDLESEAQETFLQVFMKARNEIIIPAFKEFAAQIGPHGWTGQIEVIEEKPAQHGHSGRVEEPAKSAGVSMLFYRGDVRPYNAPGRLPHFKISCDKQNRIAHLYGSTIGPNHGGSGGSIGDMDILSLTYDEIQKRLVKYFKGLMKDARPYDER